MSLRGGLEQAGEKSIMRGGGAQFDLLATGAPVSPDIPGALVTLLGADSANLRAGDSLVVAVVPLTDVLGDLDPGGALRDAVAADGSLAVRLPGQVLVGEAQVEELECPLGSLAGGYVAVARKKGCMALARCLGG